MLRMIAYGVNDEGDGMNLYLNSAASPAPKCVKKSIAIENGTSTTKMQEFEDRNAPQTFPGNRLIPVWPVKESMISTACTAPFDSSRMRIDPTGSSANKNVDSYHAGYTYTLENVPSWVHYERMNTTKFHGNNGEVWDEGFGFWADDLPAGTTERQAWVIINALQNETTMAAAEAYASANGLTVNKGICARSRILVRQAASGTSGNTFVGISQLNIGATGTVENNTRINLALVSDEPVLSGMYFANGTIIGNHSGEYDSVASASGSTATINIAQIKAKLPNANAVTFDLYGSWEGSGPTGVIPVPIRQSHRIDLSGNGTVMFNPNMTACGNMNIGGTDIDQTSNVVDKLRARAAYVARIRYTLSTDTVVVEQVGLAGICPVFYPTSLNGTSNAFTWLGSGDSTDRSFEAVHVNKGVLTIGVRNDGGSAFEVYMANDNPVGQYIINGTSVSSSSNKVRVTGSTFTIDLSDSKYTTNSTHGFYLRQIIDSSIVSSGNASPEYAYIRFTIAD